MMKRTLLDFIQMKSKGEKITWITSYDFAMASAIEKAGVDMILVGDSGGMVQLGYNTTNPVTMDEMMILASSVRRGAPNTFIVGDMPQGSYEISNSSAVSNALRFIKEAGCDAVKLEGGVRMAERVKAIVDAGIIVVGHLGLTPQSAASFGGYKVQGKSLASFENTIKDAIELQSAGASLLLLEAMPSQPAQQVAMQLEIPVMGIGAGGLLDGQLIIAHDALGYYSGFRPKFTKCYIPQVIESYNALIKESDDLDSFGRLTQNDGLLTLTELAVKDYVLEVKSGMFPGDKYAYSISSKDLDVLKKSNYWK